MVDLTAVEQCAKAVIWATDGNGMKIVLLQPRELYDPIAVLKAIRTMASAFDEHSQFFGENGEDTAVRNLGLLCDLYNELRAEDRLRKWKGKLDDAIRRKSE